MNPSISGSTATISPPTLDTSMESGRSAPLIQNLPGLLPRKRILVVDDDASIRQSLSKVLEEAGYEVSLAADGQQALSLFDPDRIDLLVLDLGLPMKSGWDIFEEITNQDPVLPIIIITGQPNQRFTACAAGVGALMEKPLDVPALLQTMEDLLTEPHEARLKRLCGQGQNLRFVPPASTMFLRSVRDHSPVPFPRLKLDSEEDP